MFLRIFYHRSGSSLSSLTQHLYSPEIILYQAGVDVHQVDKLDYLALSDTGVASATPWCSIARRRFG